LACTRQPSSFFIAHAHEALTPPRLGRAQADLHFHVDGSPSPTYETFSHERLRAEHLRHMLANTALESEPEPCPHNCSYPEGGYCDLGIGGIGVCFCNGAILTKSCRP